MGGWGWSGGGFEVGEGGGHWGSIMITTAKWEPTIRDLENLSFRSSTPKPISAPPDRAGGGKRVLMGSAEGFGGDKSVIISSVMIRRGGTEREHTECSDTKRRLRGITRLSPFKFPERTSYTGSRISIFCEQSAWAVLDTYIKRETKEQE